MTTHISDDLPRLLTGEATRDVVLDAAAHLRACPDCQQELVSAVVAHASLTSAHRFAPEIVAAVADASSGAQPAGGPLPDMSGIFAQVRGEATTVASRPQRRRNLLAVAAAAVVLTGAGITVATTVGSDSTQPPTRTVALQPFGQGTHPAKATLVGSGRLKVDATSLPKLDSGHYYEVWLTDDQRQNMYPVGSIGNGNTADLTVKSSVVSHYNDIEVSVQKTNQIKYSGVSVLRGSYG